MSHRSSGQQPFGTYGMLCCDVMCHAVLCCPSREVNVRYMREMSRVSFKLLELFALGLGLQPRALDSMFQPSHTSFLRLNYYVSVAWFHQQHSTAQLSAVVTVSWRWWLFCWRAHAAL